MHEVRRLQTAIEGRNQSGRDHAQTCDVQLRHGKRHRHGPARHPQDPVPSRPGDTPPEICWTASTYLRAVVGDTPEEAARGLLAALRTELAAKRDKVRAELEALDKADRDGLRVVGGEGDK
jgi:hypothetical protein